MIKKDNFICVPVDLITDITINATALRLYCYLISKPEFWEFKENDIMKQLGIDDKSLIQKYIKELINAGYINKNQIIEFSYLKLESIVK